MADPTYKAPTRTVAIQSGVCCPSSAGIPQWVTPHIWSVDTQWAWTTEPQASTQLQELFFLPHPTHAFPPAHVAQADLSVTSQVLGQWACTTTPGFLSAGDETQDFTHARQVLYQPSHIPSPHVPFF